MSALVPIFLKIAPEHIAFLKFAVESYEDIGIVRTLDRTTGEVVVLALSDTVFHVRQVLQSLTPGIDIELLESPTNIEGDWLLAEENLCR